MNTVTCDKCGNIIKVDQVLEEQIRHKIEDQERAKAILEIEKRTREIEEKTSQKIKADLDLAIKTSQAEASESKERNKQLQEQLLELTKQLRKLNTEKEDLKLEMQKKLLEEQDKIRNEVKEKAAEEHRLKIMELSKQLQDASKVNDELKRKLEQGSQQTQGEVQELDLENLLKDNFRDDEIEPIAKGIQGADIRQIVKSPKRGIECGVILWESKRTKTWSDSWLNKLKSDMVSTNATIPVIISEVLPEEAKLGIGTKDGVWIGSPKLALWLGTLLRKSLLDSAKQKTLNENNQTKAQEIYTYITSPEFANQVTSMLEIYKEMKGQIDRERTAFEKSWKQREAQIGKLQSGVGGIYGFMQGIAGQALPTITPLELDTPN